MGPLIFGNPHVCFYELGLGVSATRDLLLWVYIRGPGFLEITIESPGKGSFPRLRGTIRYPQGPFMAY